MGADGNAPPAVQLRGVTKHFGKVIAVHEIDLDIPDGSLTTLLGPSGCGKSTLLRAIAGLVRLSRGEVWIDAENITHTAPHRRGVPLMLQAFPLWPHMTVGRNVAFGLQRQRLSRREIRERVTRELEYVGLSHFRRHLPWQLTPSQQQRVSLARTLISAARIGQDQQTGEIVVATAERVAAIRDGLAPNFDWPSGAEISVADGASGCPSVEGAFVALLDPARGMLLLSAAPFPGGHPVGDARGAEMTLSLPGFGSWKPSRHCSV